MLAILPTANAAPPADDHGYVDSTARCVPPSALVVFGSTANSRVAICESADGRYEYRGVRIRDGARLIVPATRDEDGEFVADNHGVTYTLTSRALVISLGERVIREEPMVDFHRAGGADAPAAASAAPSSTPTTPLPPPLPAEVGHTGG